MKINKTHKMETKINKQENKLKKNVQTKQNEIKKKVYKYTIQFILCWITLPGLGAGHAF